MRLLRFTAADVLSNPDSIVRQVSDMLELASAGNGTSAPQQFRSDAGTRAIRS